MNSSQIMAIIIIVVIVAVLGILSCFNNSQSLNKTKARTVGDGQFGNARWATKKELSKSFKYIDYTPYLWRKGKNLPSEPAIVLNIKGHGRCKAMIDTSDSNTMMISAPGGFKTTGFLYHNIEYCLASEASFLCTDTKGDLYRDWALIAKNDYGYLPYIIDLRNSSKSHPKNIISNVNKYMDTYIKTGDIRYQAFAERAAKNIAHSIVYTKGFGGGGQNAFFYDAAEGLIASVILLVSELCIPSQQHIVSVFKLCQELLEIDSSTEKRDKDGKIIKNPIMYIKKIMDMLPPEHKAKWLASPALNSSNQSMMSVISTAMSRMLSFIDSDIEQIICSDSDINGEDLANHKIAVFIVFPEEDATKHFLVSLIIRQFYDELLEVASKNNNKLPKRVYFYEDEFGTLPAFNNVEDMFSAGRSRGLIQIPLIQSFGQLEKNYKTSGEKIIKDCAQNAILGWLAPLSDTNDNLSKMLGNQTVSSASVSSGKDSKNRTIQMTGKALMSPQAIRAMPKGHYILMKSGLYPTKIKIERYTTTKAIQIDKPYTMEEQPYHTIEYANRDEFICSIQAKYGTKLQNEEDSLKIINAADY